MKSSKTTFVLAAAVALLATATALYQWRSARRTRNALASVEQQQSALRAKLHTLESQLAVATQDTQLADRDRARLSAAVKAVPPPRPTVDAAPITHASVEARLNHAKDLARSGDAAAALREFLWCFDVGMPRVPGFAGVRLSYVLDEILHLADTLPAAREALLERRDQARQQALAGTGDFDAAMVFSAINRVLHDEPATLALHDQFPPDDPRRTKLAIVVYDQLVAAQRYPEAAHAVQYNNITSMLDLARNDPRMLEFQVKSASTYVEVLAGTGDLAHAKSLATRLLEIDGSDATQAIVLAHLTRAGHADLLGEVVRP